MWRYINAAASFSTRLRKIESTTAALHRKSQTAQAGFKDVRHVPAPTLAERYFSGRRDDLRPPKNAEELLVAAT
jgi:hypothetical protein